MKNRDSLSILIKSMIAAALLVESAFADVNGHLLVESSGIKAVDRQLDVSLTENGQVRIAWDADLLGQARLQVSDNYADWAEVPNARNPFFTSINHEVNTYFRVVYDLSGGTRDTPPEDFGNKRIYGDTDGDGVNDRGVFGTDDEPGPDLLWVDKDGDGLVDEDELTPLAAGHDTLKALISNLKTVDGGQEGAPLQAGGVQPAWLVLGIAASDSPIEGVMEFIVEILEIMKTKHDRAKAAINNVR